MLSGGHSWCKSPGVGCASGAGIGRVRGRIDDDVRVREEYFEWGLVGHGKDLTLPWGEGFEQGMTCSDIQ